MSASSDDTYVILCTTDLAKGRLRRAGAALAALAMLSASAEAAAGQVRSDTARPEAPTGIYMVGALEADSRITSRLEQPPTAPDELPWRPEGFQSSIDSLPAAQMEMGLRVAAPPPLPHGLSERHLWMAHETAAFLGAGDEANTMQTWRTLVLSARRDGLLTDREDVDAVSLWILREAFIEPCVELRWIADLLLTNSAEQAIARSRLAEIRAASEGTHDAAGSLVEEYLESAASASDAATASLRRELEQEHEIITAISFYYSIMTTYDPEIRFTD